MGRGQRSILAVTQSERDAHLLDLLERGVLMEKRAAEEHARAGVTHFLQLASDWQERLPPAGQQPRRL
ncbi:hypothetical protein HYV43_01045 [Candidatus Micrarchaeota archaeon]|nr:hypothetical protein [Candidatus Micrarchaeota archaeon]